MKKKTVVLLIVLLIAAVLVAIIVLGIKSGMNDGVYDAESETQFSTETHVSQIGTQLKSETIETETEQTLPEETKLEESTESENATEETESVVESILPEETEPTQETADKVETETLESKESEVEESKEPEVETGPEETETMASSSVPEESVAPEESKEPENVPVQSEESQPPVHTHTYVTDTKAATCVEAGYTRTYCTGCGHVESETAVNATGQHNYSGIVTTAASCSAEGVTTYTCSGCGNRYTESIPATDHFKVESAREQYCQEEGWIKYICAYCGTESTETLAPLGGEHAWVERYYPSCEPTCTSWGTIHGQTCSICGKYESLPDTPPLGHVADEGTVIHVGTCTSPATIKHVCIRCGSDMPSSKGELDPNNHYWAVDEEGEYCAYGCGATR